MCGRRTPPDGAHDYKVWDTATLEELKVGVNREEVVQAGIAG
jgi:hypothetical protein